MSNPELTRINKYLSEIGYCSRRAADKLIEQGRVTINGKIPETWYKSEEDVQREIQKIRIWGCR
jgi:23S rRNA pseudouridine2604 synthase